MPILQGLAGFLPVSSSGTHRGAWLFTWTELTRNPDLNRTSPPPFRQGSSGAYGEA